MSKQFTNQELKKLIHNLYIENLFTINEDIEKLISKSSKVRYETLLNHYNEIKNTIIEKLLKSENSSNSSNTNEYIEIKEIEIQTNNIETQTEIIENIINPQDNELHIKQTKNEKILLQKNFTLNKKIDDYIFKYENLKKEFNQYRKFTNDSKNKYNNKNYNSSSDEEIKEKEFRKIPYHQLPEMSSVNIIKELTKLNRHQLKQLYNKYFSSKINRQFSIYN